MGEWVIMYSKEEEEYAMLYWSPTWGYRMVLTNAFTHKKNKKSGRSGKRTPTSENIIWDAYEFYFNGDDRFNHFMAGKYFPYPRKGWRQSYDDLYFSVAMTNIYCLWHEIQNIQEYTPYGEYCDDLYNKLIR